MNICLDTNAYKKLKEGDKKVQEILENADLIFVPTIVLGELYAGFHAGSKCDKNIRELYDFLKVPGVEIITIQDTIPEQYGLVFRDLKRQGTPIPSNDMWIAAICMHTGSHLLTFDRHFSNVPGLILYPFL
jgi:tRNA(fMet)-specific endonuclease VapC